MQKTSSLLSGVAIGMSLGVFFGAIICVLLSVGSSLMLPGPGLVIAAWIPAGIFGAGVGATIGLIIGALTRYLVPEVSRTTAAFYNPIAVSMLITGLLGIIAIVAIAFTDDWRYSIASGNTATDFWGILVAIFGIRSRLLETSIALPGLGIIIPAWFFALVSGFGIGAAFGFGAGLVIGIISLLIKMFSGAKENRADAAINTNQPSL